VTLLVTPKQAALLTHATELGRIRLVLRSSKGENDEGVDEAISNSDIFGSSVAEASPPSPPLPTLTPLPTVTPPSTGNDIGKGIIDILNEIGKARDLGPPTPVEKPWKMILIEGIDSKEMEFTSESKLGQLTTGPGAPPGKTSSAKTTPSGDEADHDSPFTKLPPIDQEESTDSDSP
jgi:hypothetical protein